MHDLIRRIADWLTLLLSPGPGTHRRQANLRTVPAPAPTSPPAQGPRHAARLPRLPRHRSPYGVPVSLDGAAIALVRPYVVVHERDRARQRRRRMALVLAADFGVDVDQHLVGAQRPRGARSAHGTVGWAGVASAIGANETADVNETTGVAGARKVAA